jgi:predicted ATPase/class 3 adenylate cyclase
MQQLPTGTVTFLVSDIEGSTRLWEGDEPGMRRALARHDDVLRAAVQVLGGHVFKHTGDGMMAVFADAGQAIAAAVQAQRGLQHAEHEILPLAIRMAVHSGYAHERDGDYFGPTLNRVARLVAAAHGGQILVSSTAAALARERLADGIDLIDLGEHRLRDIQQPERVSQACASGLRHDFPPLRTPAGERRGFPTLRSRIIGRERLLSQIAEHLGTASLVTLTGVGGSGKTRVAIEAGTREGARFPDGVAFIDLSALAEPELIARTVAGGVGVPDMGAAGEPGRQSAADHLVAYLAARRMLLVLDNCEHLIDGCAALVDRVLAECPQVKVLATSREGLAMEGESTIAVPPLQLPQAGRSAAESEAVQLFVERAHAVRSELDLLGQHEAAVVDVCRRLDGIPLAIELAAVHLTHFTPEEVADRLHDRFRLLAGGRRRVHRHATLQAAVDWSYELLDESARVLLARLGVFVGDFSLDAVEGICAGDGVHSKTVMPLLASLVAKSLVVATAYDRTTRYRLLETIRLYAEQRLVERGEAAAVRARHRDWYLSWVEALDRERLGAPLIRAMADHTALKREVDNLRAALRWSDEERRSDLIGRMVAAMDGLWVTHSYLDEGLRWLRAVGEQPSDDLALAARCATVDGWLTMGRGDFMQVPVKAQTALDMAERAGLLASKRPEAVGALILAGFCQAYGDRDAGRTLIGRARRIAAANGLHAAAACAKGYEGMLWLMEGDFNRASQLLEEMRRETDSARPRLLTGLSLAELTVALHLASRHEQALSVAIDVVQSPRELTIEMYGIVNAASLAFARAGAGILEHTLPELLDLFDRARRDNVPVVAPFMLTLVAAVLAMRGDDEAASTILSTARAQGDLPFRNPGHYAVFRHYGHLLRQRLGDDVAQRCRDAGAQLSLDAAADIARRIATPTPANRTP